MISLSFTPLTSLSTVNHKSLILHSFHVLSTFSFHYSLWSVPSYQFAGHCYCHFYTGLPASLLIGRFRAGLPATPLLLVTFVRTAGHFAVIGHVCAELSATFLIGHCRALCCNWSLSYRAAGSCNHWSLSCPVAGLSATIGLFHARLPATLLLLVTFQLHSACFTALTICMQLVPSPHCKLHACLC